MATRDQWYKPNLLYNIHWRPPKTTEEPKMVVKTVRFNPSVCTCGEHNCGPHYRMERKVVWINKETTNTAEDKKKGEGDSRPSLQSDQDLESNESEVLHSKEEKISDANDEERCTEEEIYNREITKESCSVGYGKGLDVDDNWKYGRSKDSSETEGLENHGNESGGGYDEFSVKKEWLAKSKEDSCDSCEEDDLKIEADTERKSEDCDSVDVNCLKIKDHRDTGEKVLDDYHNNNLRTIETLKQDCDEYFIRNDESMYTKSDEECDDSDFRNRVINDGDNSSVNCERKMIEVTPVHDDDKSVGEKVGEDLKSNCDRNNEQYNYSLSTESIIGNGDRCNGETDEEERCKVYSSDNSGEGLEEDDTEKIYDDDEISPAFGIMSIFCRSELHYMVLGSCA